LAFLLGAVSAAGNTLPNGLELGKFEVITANPAIVGSTVTVEMVLTNRSNQPLQFDGEVYWPDGSIQNPINYYYKGYKTTGDISMSYAGWMNTVTIFRVPAGISQPILVAITWQGGDRYEFAGVRLD
jgi:hypothetical protein